MSDDESKSESESVEEEDEEEDEDEDEDEKPERKLYAFAESGEDDDYDEALEFLRTLTSEQAEDYHTYKEEGMTALMLFTDSDAPEEVLFAMVQSINGTPSLGLNFYNETDDDASTVLHYAAESSASVAFVEYLLCVMSFKAIKSKGDGATILECAAKREPELKEISDTPRIVALIEEALADHKAFIAKHSKTNVFFLSFKSVFLRPDISYDMVRSALAESPSVASTLLVAGSFPLHFLAASTSVTVESLRLLAGAYPEALKAISHDGVTPFQVAASNKAVTVRLLEDGLLPFRPRAAKDKSEGEECALRFARDGEVSEEVQAFLFGLHPVPEQEFESIAQAYLASFKASTPTELASFISWRQNGWVELVASDCLERFSSLLPSCKDLISTCSDESAAVLAYSRDFGGRIAIEVAVPELKQALRSRLLFLGRFDLAPGPPVHQSATCVVRKAADAGAEEEYRARFVAVVRDKENKSVTKVELRAVLKDMGLVIVDDKLFDEKFSAWDADGSKTIGEDEFLKICKSELDNNGERQVVLKFMQNKDQFLREISAREANKLESKFVVGISQKYDDKTPNFLSSLSSKGYANYKHAIVMPCADRNLDTIFRSERPDINVVRTFGQQIAEALRHLHAAGLSHGDLKLLNVVRVAGRLCLIDLDASAAMGSFAGAKFSSGVLPPEMIAKLATDKEVRLFGDAFMAERRPKEQGGEPELWAKIEPKMASSAVGGDAHYVVKTWSEREEVKNASLPYSRLVATPALDIWSFGTVMYYLCSSSQLFKTNRDEDCENGDVMAALHHWSDDDLQKTVFGNVEDTLAQSLLLKLLAPNPDDRPSSMDEVLLHPFFNYKAGGDGRGGGSASDIAAFESKLRAEIKAKFEKEASDNARVMSDKVAELERQAQSARSDQERDAAKLQSVLAKQASNIDPNARMEEMFKQSMAMQMALLEKQEQTIRNTEALKQSVDAVAAMSRQILKNTVSLALIAEATSRKMDRCTSTLLTAIVEAGDITAPTTFIILPHRLGEGGDPEGNLMNSMLEIDEVSSLTSMASLVGEFRKDKKGMKEKWLNQAKATMKNPADMLKFVSQMEDKCNSFEASVNKAEGIMNQASALLADPFQFGKKLLAKSVSGVLDKYKGDTFYLYLIDEYRGVPVSDGVYPIEITKQSAMLEKAMPYMKLGVTAMKLANGLSSVARIFGVPSPKIPANIIKSAEQGVKSLDQESTVAEFDVLQGALDDVSSPNDADSSKGKKKTLRGKALKELHAFIMSKDTKGDFSGLIRICEAGSGRIIWTTKEGKDEMEEAEKKVFETPAAGKVELDFNPAVEGRDAEIERLKAELGQIRSSGGITGAPPPPPPQSLKADDATASAQVLAKRNEDLEAQVQALEEKVRTLRSISSASESSVSAQPSTPKILKSASLMKKSKYLRKYERRFIDFNVNGLLSWDGGTGHSGFVKLTRTSVIQQGDEKEDKADSFPFMVIHDGKTIELATKTESERLAWITIINNFIEAEIALGM